MHDQTMNLMMKTGLKRSGIQLASSGRWESALSVERMSPSAVNEWLAAADKDVAIEALYVDDSGDLQGFIGFRRCLDAVEERVVFWLKVLESSRTPKNPKDNMTEWLELLGQPSLLDTPADGIELGVFNQWHSAGPIALHSNRLTKKDLQIGPEWISRGSTAPICREHFWQRPERIWVADVISRGEGRWYVLDSTLLPK